jgi:hypothetical protein
VTRDAVNVCYVFVLFHVTTPPVGLRANDDLGSLFFEKIGAELYRGADKSLAQRTSRCILFDGENISLDASLVIYLNNTNIPPIMIINRIYEYQNPLSLVSFMVGLRTDQHPSSTIPTCAWRN